MLSAESVPYTVGKQIAPAFQISIVHLLQTKSREARAEPKGPENSGIQQITISVYRLRNLVEVQLYGTYSCTGIYIQLYCTVSYTE